MVRVDEFEVDLFDEVVDLEHLPYRTKILTLSHVCDTINYRAPKEVFMTRAQRRKQERAEEKAARRREKLMKKFREGWEVVQAGGWPEWSGLVMTNGPGSEFCREIGADYWFANSRYQVLVKFEKAGGWPPLVHLSIKAHDKRCVRDWRDMQRIKNEIVGPEAEGLELYPAESRLMDEANQFHIYCAHPVVDIPFGQDHRTVSTPEELEEENKDKNPLEKPRQRAFEPHHNGEGCRPEGLIEWPSWALESLEKLGFRVKEAEAS